MADFPQYPATSFDQAVDLTIFSGNQLGDIINGDALTEVPTENGPIPTVRKSLVDNLYFKSPEAWEPGQNETVFNQLRTWRSSTYSGLYYAPSATSTHPVLMTAAGPANDANWVLYTAATQVPSLVTPYTHVTTQPAETVISPPYTFTTAIVAVNGVMLVPDIDFTVVNNQIILTSPIGYDEDSGTQDVLFTYLGSISSGGTGGGSGGGSDTISWVYNDGSALGGETTLTPPYIYTSVPAVYIDGERKVVDIHYTYTSTTITLITPLATGALFQAILNSEVNESDIYAQLADLDDRVTYLEEHPAENINLDMGTL